MKKIIFSAAIAAGIIAFAQSDVSAQSWSLNGNATSSANFLGTTNAQPLKFKTNGITRMVITKNAKFGFNNTSPVYKVDILGSNSDTVIVTNSVVKFTGDKDVIALNGTSQPAPGWGIGVQGNGNFIGTVGNGGAIGVFGTSLGIGVHGEASDVGNTEILTGVRGLTSGGDIGAGVYGNSDGALTNYGVYGEQQDTASGTDYALVGVGDAFAWRYFIPSDRKLKNNIEPLTGALEKVSQLTASTYTFDQQNYPGMALPSGKSIGFMAENIEQFFPELIKNGPLPAGATREKRGKVVYHSIQDVKTVNYLGIIPVLAEAIKEQKAIVDAKDAQIADLNSRLTALENLLSETSSARLTSAFAAEASIEQNNPNPFNQATQIRYTVPKNYNDAKIIVTNMEGKSVLNYSVKGSGRGTVTINASELAAGTYTYSLNVDGKTVDTKTMVLTK